MSVSAAAPAAGVPSVSLIAPSTSSPLPTLVESGSLVPLSVTTMSWKAAPPAPSSAVIRSVSTSCSLWRRKSSLPSSSWNCQFTVPSLPVSWLKVSAASRSVCCSAVSTARWLKVLSKPWIALVSVVVPLKSASATAKLPPIGVVIAVLLVWFAASLTVPATVPAVITGTSLVPVIVIVTSWVRTGPVGSATVIGVTIVSVSPLARKLKSALAFHVHSTVALLVDASESVKVKLPAALSAVTSAGSTGPAAEPSALVQATVVVPSAMVSVSVRSLSATVKLPVAAIAVLPVIASGIVSLTSTAVITGASLVPTRVTVTVWLAVPPWSSASVTT